MDRAAGGGLGGSRCFGNKGAQPIAVLPVGPLVALAESPAPLTWDRAYIELMSPLPGVMGAGRVLDADDEGLDGDISVWISASVH